MSKIGTQRHFSEDFAPKQAEEILFLLKTKGQEYSKDSAFANFVSVSSMVRMSPFRYLMTVASKHWAALIDFACGRTNLEVESARKRIQDVIIYLLLLLYMLTVKEETGEIK